MRKLLGRHRCAILAEVSQRSPRLVGSEPGLGHLGVREVGETFAQKKRSRSLCLAYFIECFSSVSLKLWRAYPLANSPRIATAATISGEITPTAETLRACATRLKLVRGR